MTRTSTRPDTAALALGAAANGVLAYAVFALATRALGADAAAVSVLWTFWAFTGAAVTFPVQHWITRTAVAHGEGAVRGALVGLGLVVATLSLGLGAVAAALRVALFDRPDLAFPLLVAAMTLGSAVVGVVRGVLSARARFRAVAASLALENALRCVAALALVVSGSRDPAAYGAALVAGFLVAVIWPTSFRLSTQVTSLPATRPLRFLGSTGAAQLLNQVLLTGGPVALALAGGSPVQVTALFAALSLFRAPYLVALGVLPQLTERATRVTMRDPAAVRRLALPVVASTAVLVATAGVLGAQLGPWALRLVFGSDVRLAAGAAAVVAAGSVVAVANLVSMSVVIAQDRSPGAARSWLVAAGAAVVTYPLLLATAPLERIVWAFLAAQACAYAGLLAVALRPLRPAPAAGSS